MPKVSVGSVKQEDDVYKVARQHPRSELVDGRPVCAMLGGRAYYLSFDAVQDSHAPICC